MDDRVEEDKIATSHLRRLPLRRRPRDQVELVKVRANRPGVIADYLGSFEDPDALALQLSTTTGVVEHGLFPASMVSDVLIGRGEDVERMTPVDHRTPPGP